MIHNKAIKYESGENVESIIETVNLTKTYSAVKAVDSVSITVVQGEIYGLLGRNGAGKTSIMKMLLSLTRPTDGSIKIFNQNINGFNREIMNRIGSSIESPAFYPNLSAKDNLEYFAFLRGERDLSVVKNALDTVDLSYESKKTFSKFSLGMKQRLALANAIMFNPDLLILDEPTNGLDPIGIAEMRELIKRFAKENRKTVLISSHQLFEIELLADKIGIIDNGRLLEECSYNELKMHEKKSTIIVTNRNEAALSILHKEFNVENYSLSDNTIEIPDSDIDTANLNTLLVSSGVEVREIYTRRENLEEHFKSITGGVGIA